MTGAKARSETEISHVESVAHREAVKTERIKGLSDEEKVGTVSLFKISKALVKRSNISPNISPNIFTRRSKKDWVEVRAEG